MCRLPPRLGYRVIYDERGQAPYRALCMALGVSSSADYAWRCSAPSAREAEEHRLAVEVSAVRCEGRRASHALRLHVELSNYSALYECRSTRVTALRAAGRWPRCVT